MGRSTKVLGVLAGLAILALGAAGCAQGTAGAAGPRYQMQQRSFTITAVPLLVHEQQGMFDYLKGAFAKGGMLADKEVWGFSPSSITVYQWDTVNVSLVNPGDDAHTFTIPELGVNANMKGGSTSRVSFTANKVGSFAFVCTMMEHAPYMWGTITVLPDSAGVP
jgi:plastocyanin